MFIRLKRSFKAIKVGKKNLDAVIRFGKGQVVKSDCSHYPLVLNIRSNHRWCFESKKWLIDETSVPIWTGQWLIWEPQVISHGRTDLDKLKIYTNKMVRTSFEVPSSLGF